MAEPPEPSRKVIEFLLAGTRTRGRCMGADRAGEFGRRDAVPGELLVRVQSTKVNAGFDISN